MYKTIVVTDDTEFIDQLKSLEGYDFTFVSDEKQLTDTLDASYFKFALFDVELPETLYERLNRVYTIVFVGTAAQQSLIADYIKAKSGDFIIKPIHSHLLEIRLRKALSEVPVEEYIGFASHELKNPLTAIIGYTAVLLSDLAMHKEIQLQAKEIILSNAYKIERILNNLIDIAHIDTGSFREYSFQSFSLNELLQNAYHWFDFPPRNNMPMTVNFANYLEKQGQYLTIHLPDNLPEVFGNIGLTKQMIELLIYSMQYESMKGSEIIISAREKDHFVLIKLTVASIKAYYEEMEMQFTRNQTYPLFSELGVVVRFVEVQKGQLWVEWDEDTQSTSLCFTLPVAE